MGLLARALVGMACSVAACYAPELRDCTLACASTGDCASGQVCGSDQFCASPEIAGSCEAAAPVDAGVPNDGPQGSTAPDAAVPPMPDAGTPDGPPPSPTATITTKLDGKGFLELASVGTCDSDPPQNGQCTFVVALGQSITVRAYADPGWRFDRWTTSACPTWSSTCTFVALPGTQVGVKFRKGSSDDDDD
jgi:hypothetical protein